MKTFLGQRGFWSVVALTIAMSIFAPKPAVAAWQIGDPICTYWYGPVLTPDVAQAAVDTNFNLVWCMGPDNLDLADLYHLRGMYSHALFQPSTLDTAEGRAQLDAMIELVRNKPAMYGYYLGDELPTVNFAGLAALVDYIRQRDSEHMIFLNCLPDTDYISSLVSTVHPSILSYDYYQFMNYEDSSEYFKLLAFASQTARQAGIPLLNSVQGCAWDTDWRIPNTNELRFLVYTNLAYGAQGISYFNYTTQYPYTGGIAPNPDGSPTSVAVALTPLNREFVAVAKQVQSLHPFGAYHLGDLPPGTTRLPANSPFTITPSVPDTTYQEGTPVKGYVLGLFGPDSQLANATHAIVVNLDYTSSKTITIAGPENLSVFNATTSNWSAANSSQVTVELLPGGGALVTLTRLAPITITTTGLGGYWKVNGNGNDESGHGLNFADTYGGGFTYDTQDGVKGTSSISFNPDTSGNAAVYAPAASCGYLKSAWKMSFSAWIKFKTNNTPYARINSQWGGENGDLYQIYWNKAAKTFNLYMANINNVATGVSSQEVNLQTDTWYHLVVTANTETPAGSPNVQFYLTPYGAADVVSIGSGEWAPADGTRLINYMNNQPFILGNAFNGTDWTFNGKMDEIRFYYSNALSLSDVRNMYIDAAPQMALFFNPIGGVYDGSKNVTITCNTPSAIIRYTTNGTEPTTGNGTVITSGSSITVNKSLTLKAKAWPIGGGDPGIISSASYTILRAGDANGDGAVDVGDLGILAANYGTTSGASWSQGDFNGDGAVDVGDLGILAAHYGEGSVQQANFNADYAKAFGTATQDAPDEEIDSLLCSGMGLPLLVGFSILGLLLVKLEE